MLHCERRSLTDARNAYRPVLGTKKKDIRYRKVEIFKSRKMDLKVQFPLTPLFKVRTGDINFNSFWWKFRSEATGLFMLVFIIFFIHLSFAFSGSPRDSRSLNKAESPSKKLEVLSSSDSALIDSLRSRAKIHLICKEYDEAACCYSAIVQSLEGAKEFEAGVETRHALLTLAECEIKLGHLLDAVARCSEVIYESPPGGYNGSGNQSQAEDVQTLGKAFYRRAVAFERLGMPVFAFLDNIHAIDCPEVSLKASALHARLLETEEVKGLLTSRGSSTMSGEEAMEKENELKQDTIDEAMLNFPRKRFSNREIAALIGDNSRALKKSKKSFGGTGSSSPFNFGSFMGTGERQAGSGGFNPGSIMSMFMEPGSLQNCMEMLSAVNWFRKLITGFVRTLKQNHHFVVALLTIIWLVRVSLT